MRNLEEAFRDRESRVKKVVMFIDMTDSTDLKLNNSEATWLTTYGWFFDTVRGIIEAGQGTVVKYLGDGVMIVFDPDYAAEAINSGIRIQESVAKGNAIDSVRCHCSIGIAFGAVVEFDTSEKNIDFIGSVVDKAARLCAAASPKAIFVDSDTISAASMTKIASSLGTASPTERTIKQYQGEIQLVNAKGFSSPLEYYEIYWGEQRYGLKSEVGTAAVGATSPIIQKNPPSSVPHSSHAADDEHRAGTVKTWNAVRNIGFIKSGDEDFFFSCDYMANPEPPDEGSEVFFLPRPPIKGNSRLAACVCVLDEELEGKIITMVKDFGFVQVSDSQGNTQDIFMHVGENPANFAVGDEIAFTVAKGKKGIRANDLKRPES